MKMTAVVFFQDLIAQADLIIFGIFYICNSVHNYLSSGTYLQKYGSVLPTILTELKFNYKMFL